MNYATKTRLVSGLRAGLLGLGFYGAYAAYSRFTPLARDGELILAAARKAQDLVIFSAGAPGGPAALEEFRAGYYALGKALDARSLYSPVNRAAFRAANADYYDVLLLAEEFFPGTGPRHRAAAAKALRGRLVRIAGTCLQAADRNLDERVLLLERTALLAFLFLLVLAALETAVHCLIAAPFLESLDSLRRRIRHFAWAPQPPAPYSGEIEELRAGTEALERGIQDSMLDRLRLAKESAGRRARMKTQTRALELTRKKVVELVEDLDAARAQLQKEKKVLKETGEKLARSNKDRKSVV